MMLSAQIGYVASHSLIRAFPCKEGAKMYVRGMALVESEARKCTT